MLKLVQTMAQHRWCERHKDVVENFDGMSGDAEIGADDQASPVIDSARDKAESWAGSVF